MAGTLTRAAVAVAGEAKGPDVVEEDGEQVSLLKSWWGRSSSEQLPSDANPSSEVDKVDSALEQVEAAQS